MLLRFLFRNCFRLSSSFSKFNSAIDKTLDDIRSAGTWKSERVITTAQSSVIGVVGANKSILNFCANNYLGLSNHKEIVAAGKAVLDSHGAGLSSVRFICGTMDIHRVLEKKIAKFHGTDDSILYAACFDANAGLFETLLGPNDAVISDELNHASIIDGIRLSKAQRFRYKHIDMKDLEEQLKIASETSKVRLIATDGVFSMDGSISPLRDICDLADKYEALVFVDECHATGFFGKTGRGTEEYWGMSGRVDIVNSTLGKALGGAAGGYTTSSHQVVSLLRQRSRPYLFSNSLPPAVVACGSKVFDMLMGGSGQALITKLHSNTKLFRSQMKAAGFKLGGNDEHPICPVMLGDARLASEFADKMLKRDIYVIGFSFPVVPKGKARIRVQLSADHSEEDINRAVEAFTDVGRELNVIS